MDPVEINVSSIKKEEEYLLACRICLACDVKLYNIRDLGLDQTYVEMMGTTLSVWDGFPQHLCGFCCTLLVKGQELRARCRRAEELLKQSLMHQHFVTTDYIRTIDRKEHRLTYELSFTTSNAAVNIYTYQDEVTDAFSTDNVETKILNTALSELDEKVIAYTRDNPNVKDFDLFSESSDKCDEFDTLGDDKEELSLEKCEVFSMDGKLDAAKLELDSNVKIVKVAKGNLKRKSVNKVEKAPKGKRKKKTREIPFETEEHFKPFEEKYNFKVIKLTDEDIARDMEARKDSLNYKNAVKKCELCFKGFLSEDTYNNHMKIHDPARGPLDCHICHTRYKYPAHLRRHLNSHGLKFKCTVCQVIVNDKLCAELHADFHAGTTFKCKHCDMQFLKKTSRSTHARLAHPMENADGGTCEICGETFMSDQGLKAHKTRSHKQQPVLPRMRCRKCKVQFETIEAVERHRNDQPSGTCDPKLSACAQCGATFPGEAEVMQHRVSAHGLQLFNCDKCSKTFTSSESLSTHTDRVHLRIRVKAPLRPGWRPAARGLSRPEPARCRAYEPVCELCGKRVRCMALLKLHMARHSGERPFKCSLCPKAYCTRTGLVAHEAFHTKERKYQCPECPAMFMHKSSIYQHMVIHRGDRSFLCKICNKSFTQSGSLSTHIRYVHMKIKPPPRNRKKKTATTT